MISCMGSDNDTIYGGEELIPSMVVRSDHLCKLTEGDTNTDADTIFGNSGVDTICTVGDVENVYDGGVG